MLNYSDITAGKFIILDGDPYEVLNSQTSKKSRQKASNQTKIKNLRSGKVTEKAFHQSDSVEEADLQKEDAVFIYHNRGEFMFHEEDNPGARFAIPEELIGTKGNFLKEKGLVTTLRFKDEVIGVEVPIKVDLLVTEAAPAVRGNTAQGATKSVIVETGAQITTPLFINQGDLIRINTESGDYVERVEKA